MSTRRSGGGGLRPDRLAVRTDHGDRPLRSLDSHHPRELEEGKADEPLGALRVAQVESAGFGGSALDVGAIPEPLGHRVEQADRVLQRRQGATHRASDLEHRVLSDDAQAFAVEVVAEARGDLGPFHHAVSLREVR
jgi:hypothetical protein